VFVRCYYLDGDTDYVGVTPLLSEFLKVLSISELLKAGSLSTLTIVLGTLSLSIDYSRSLFDTLVTLVKLLLVWLG